MNSKETYEVNASEDGKPCNNLCKGTIHYMWANKRPHFIVGIILFTLFISLLIIFVALQLSVIYSYNYAIVIDAGSTGTRAYLYEWKDEPGVINDAVVEKMSKKTDKLQNVYQNEADNDLLKCVTELIYLIPSSYISKPTIYLAATAGMRLFKIENPDLTDKIFNDIKQLFVKKGWKALFVGIISGETEAISGWITANYLKNTIGKNKLSASVKTIGALDLGGSSTQIALESRKKNISIDLYDKKFSVYAVSYLCYGVNMFYIEYMSSIAINPNETSFHCLLNGSPIPPREDSVTCRAKGSEKLNFAAVNKSVKPNPDKCRTQIRNILTPVIDKNIIDKDSQFVAVSSFYFYQKFLKDFYNIDNTFSSLVYGTGQFCQENYNDLQSKFPLDWKFFREYCFVGNYIITLLELYGFDEKSFKNIEFTNEIGGLSVGWNLGYIIDKTRYIPDSLIYRLNNTVFIVVVTLSAVFSWIILILFVFTMWERHQKVDNINV